LNLEKRLTISVSQFSPEAATKNLSEDKISIKTSEKITAEEEIAKGIVPKIVYGLLLALGIIFLIIMVWALLRKKKPQT